MFLLAPLELNMDQYCSLCAQTIFLACSHDCDKGCGVMRMQWELRRGQIYMPLDCSNLNSDIYHNTSC